MFSPAWIETQEYLTQSGAEVADPAMARVQAERVRANPNDWLTPIGALCWAQHELERTSSMAFAREELDEWMAPLLVRDYGLDEGLLSGGVGPATTRRVLAALAALAARQATTTSVVPGSVVVEAAVVEWLRTVDYEGGEGTEWVAALDAVAGEEWAAAVRVGGGLSTEVLAYAEALATAARDTLSGNPTADDVQYGESVAEEEYWAFVEAAKYDQNCRRAFLIERPPPLTFDIPDETVPGSERPTTTVRSGSVRVSGVDLNGVLRLGISGVGVGYSRPGGAGSLTDTTFRHGGVGYEVERLLWWPNGTIRLDVYPDGLHTAVGDDAYLVITPGEDDNPIEYVWDTADASYLGRGGDFVWDTTFTPEFGTVYRVELRIGVPGVPENVAMSGTSVVWDAGDGPAVTKYHVWIRPATPGPGTDSFFNTPTFGTEASWDMRGMARYVGDSFVFQVRARNSAGYSPWTEPQTFTTPGATTTTTAAPTTSTTSAPTTSTSSSTTSTTAV